ncbi:MAG TPA: hydroxymethylbilane synthase, partial [Candidatus Hydrogenedentes bacterium]|nr:hydroxymethylbilane synthase [Candidatus Hydrogenedentota bacterium]
MKIVFGTRGSALALAQTQHIITKCAAYVPELEAEIKIIKTTGDQLSQAPLSEIGGLGAFTREIEQALQSGRIDVAVHSLKDLPIEQPDGL